MQVVLGFGDYLCWFYVRLISVKVKKKKKQTTLVSEFDDRRKVALTLAYSMIRHVHNVIYRRTPPVVVYNAHCWILGLSLVQRTCSVWQGITDSVDIFWFYQHYSMRKSKKEPYCY